MGIENIHETWMRLYQWISGHGYKVLGMGLEEHINSVSESDLDKLLLDLYLPIAE